jgi:ATP-dependent DNA ligase
LQDSLGKLGVKNAVIDGEIACVDEEGRSIFNELLFRRGCPMFYAFDILYLNDRDPRQLPLIERKKMREVIEKNALPDVLCGKYVGDTERGFVQRSSAEKSRRSCSEAQQRGLPDGGRLTQD